ncbi:sulfurtransferase TusA family protein [Devosia sp. MC521]|nr:sulfurtransferase TusA family protein [Devosia sp. MC521]QMW64036.1 sulfurtransferase TusA family protein [Devosia sp. MC521]
MAFTGCLFLETNVLTIDARGLKCPLPVLKLEKAAATANAGDQLLILTTDAMAKIDIPLFCRQNGHHCDVQTNGEVISLTVRIGSAG